MSLCTHATAIRRLTPVTCSLRQGLLGIFSSVALRLLRVGVLAMYQVVFRGWTRFKAAVSPTGPIRLQGKLLLLCSKCSQTMITSPPLIYFETDLTVCLNDFEAAKIAQSTVMLSKSLALCRPSQQWGRFELTAADVTALKRRKFM
jgi:hypothetical protein